MSLSVRLYLFLPFYDHVVSTQPAAAADDDRTDDVMSTVRLHLSPDRPIRHDLSRLYRRMLAQFDARQLPVARRRQRHLSTDKSNASVASNRLVEIRLLPL